MWDTFLINNKMNKKIKDLTISEFSSLIKRIVRKELKDHDPDEGLEVREEVKAILRKSAKDRKAGKLKTYSLDLAFN